MPIDDTQDKAGLTFGEMLKVARVGRELRQADLAHDLQISTQYLCDLEKGRRLPPPHLVDRICKRLNRGPLGCLSWHQAGARAHGWKI